MESNDSFSRLIMMMMVIIIIIIIIIIINEDFSTNIVKGLKSCKSNPNVKA